MFLGYLDDSDSSENGLQRFQVIGGPLIQGDAYTSLEQWLWARAWYILGEPEDVEVSEFHASKLFHAMPPYDRLKIAKCRDLFDCAVNAIAEHKVSIVYGAVNIQQLLKSEYAGSSPVDISFRRYMTSLERWIASNLDSSSGILICDDSGQKSSNRKTITDTFHQMRKRPIEQKQFLTEMWSAGSKGAIGSVRLLEDIYFSDSKYSTGVQLADICAYLISCHLAGKTEQESYFQKIADLIFDDYRPDQFGI